MHFPILGTPIQGKINFHGKSVCLKRMGSLHFGIHLQIEQFA